MRYIALIAAIICTLSLSACIGEAARNTQEDTACEPFLSSDTADEPSADELTPIYDTSAILEAHRSGDTSSLSERDAFIYTSALEVIGEIFTDGMSDEEKVIAAHDWLVANITYDTAELLPIPSRTPDTENPYGVFTVGMGICMGYTTTFQLFMDLAGIECVIVHGAAGDDNEEHAWNMVRLDGEWYHIDTTWDDFVPDDENRPPMHIYTLVPDSVMETNHVWNRENSPSATADDRIYYKTHGLFAQTAKESSALLSKAHDAKLGYAQIMTPSAAEINFDYVTSYWIIDLGDYIVTIYWII